MGTKWPSALEPARTHRTWGEGTPSQGQAPVAHFYKEGGRESVYSRISQTLLLLSSHSLSAPPQDRPRSRDASGRGPPEPSDILLFSSIYLYDYIVGNPFTFIRAFIKVAF